MRQRSTALLRVRSVQRSGRTVCGLKGTGTVAGRSKSTENLPLSQVRIHPLSRKLYWHI